MQQTRLLSGGDNKSHFEDIAVPFRFAGVPVKHPGEQEDQPFLTPSEVLFNETPAGYVYGWHKAPHKLCIITTQGEIEVEVGDGTKRRFGPGDILFAEDTAGQGHQTRVLGTEPWRSVFISFK